MRNLWGKESWEVQCGALGNVLLENVGSRHSCGCSFDTHRLPNIVSDLVHPNVAAVFPDRMASFNSIKHTGILKTLFRRNTTKISNC